MITKKGKGEEIKYRKKIFFFFQIGRSMSDGASWNAALEKSCSRVSRNSMRISFFSLALLASPLVIRSLFSRVGWKMMAYFFF